MSSITDKNIFHWRNEGSACRDTREGIPVILIIQSLAMLTPTVGKKTTQILNGVLQVQFLIVLGTIDVLYEPVIAKLPLF